VVLEFLDKILQIQNALPKFIMYLLPTSPFRESKILDRAIIKFKKLKGYDSLTSVDKMNEPVHKKFFIKNNQLKPVFSNLSIDDANKPRQSFPSSYNFNGYLYIFKTKNILKKNLGTKCFPFIIPRTIDIDDQFDLSFARYAAKYLYKINNKKF
jgi:CMP-N-acetylneuraminic acid synthetase